MSNQTALIVGASRGLGLGLAEEYLRRGWRVIATVRDAGGEAALKGLSGAERLTIERADVAVAADRRALAARIEGPLDLLFLNAGIMGPADLEGASDVEVDRVIQTNAFGPTRLAWDLIDRVRDRAGVVAFMSTGMASITDTTSVGY